MVKNFRDGLPWIPGVVIERTGPVSYLVIVRDGQLKWKRYVDHLRARLIEERLVRQAGELQMGRLTDVENQ